MKAAENLAQSPKTSRKLVTSQTDQHRADLAEWFRGLGFDPAEAELEALAWLMDEPSIRI